MRLGRALAIVAVNVALSLHTCGAQEAERAGLKIGLLLPPEEPQAISIREGVLLAQEQTGKTSTGPLHAVIRGRIGQWGADAVEAARMVTDEEVEGLITPPDGAAAHLVLQVSGRTAVPVVSLCADSSVSRTGVPWMVRLVPRTVEEAAALFTNVPSGTPGKPDRWLALVPNGRAGREIARDLKAAALACNCRLDPAVEVSSSFTNGDLRAVLSQRPDAILIWLAPIPCSELAKRLRSAGYGGVLAGPGWLHSASFTSAAGEVAEGFLIPGIVPTDASTGRWRSFQDAFQQRWGHEPDWMAGMSYDAAVLLMQILKQGGFQGPSHHLPAGFLWRGVTGDLIFDSDGNRQVKLELLRGHANGFRAPHHGD